MTGRLKAWRTALVSAVGIGLVLTVGLVAMTRKDRFVAIGAPVRLDDFSFAVVDVAHASEIGDLRPTKGAFLIVRFGIRNGARRVDYRFRDEAAFVEGDDGARFPLAIEATRKRRESPQGLAGCDAPIAAGKSCTTDLVFDVPADVASPRLGLTSGKLGDLLGWILEGSVRFALEGGSR